MKFYIFDEPKIQADVNEVGVLLNRGQEKIDNIIDHTKCIPVPKHRSQKYFILKNAHFFYVAHYSIILYD